MVEIKTLQEMRKWSKKTNQKGATIGFVPTMGFLHEGHLSLVEQAKEKADLVVMSIFVNPLQFGEGEDYESYPRDQERDKQLAISNGVDVLFCPDVNEMYAKPMSATIKVHEGTDVLCGESRPGHFDGVATVVMKLFQIVMPDYAFFGMKDAQQVAIIKRMVEDFHLDVEVVSAEIIREEDGLAKSSRNVNLTEEERQEAPDIHAVLHEAREKALNGEFESVKELEEWVRISFEYKLTGTTDYVQALDFPSLIVPESLSGDVLLAAAVIYKHARLIDNTIIKFNKNGKEHVKCSEK